VALVAPSVGLNIGILNARTCWLRWAGVQLPGGGSHNPGGGSHNQGRRGVTRGSHGVSRRRCRSSPLDSIPIAGFPRPASDESRRWVAPRGCLLRETPRQLRVGLDCFTAGRTHGSRKRKNSSPTDNATRANDNHFRSLPLHCLAAPRRHGTACPGHLQRHPGMRMAIEKHRKSAGKGARVCPWLQGVPHWQRRSSIRAARLDSSFSIQNIVTNARSGQVGRYARKLPACAWFLPLACCWS
jgi:hypothetical protein